MCHMLTLRNIKHNQKTVLLLSASKRLLRTNQRRHIQNHTKRRKTLRNSELKEVIREHAFAQVELPRTKNSHFDILVVTRVKLLKPPMAIPDDLSF